MMSDKSNTASSLQPDLLRDRKDRWHPIAVRTIVQLRWLAIIGQLVSVIIVYFRADFQWSLALALAVLLSSGIVNVQLLSQVQSGARQWLSNNEATGFLAFDVVQLGFLLWLTGGLMNPFVLLILAPVTVSASMLSKPSTALLSFLAIVSITLISLWSPPLPWRSGILRFPPTYLVAVWASIVIGILFVALFVQWVAEQARRLSNALLASQMALEREQRLSALGGLAAAAAHELGTPLSTIAVIAKELALELPQGSAAREDAEVLQQETLRCREILQKLQTSPDSDPGEPYRMVPVSTLVEIAAHAHHNSAKTLTILADPFYRLDDDAEDSDGVLDLEQGAFDQPLLSRSPEVVYGLGNLIQNAMQFARSEVLVLAQWDEKAVWIIIQDDGPGFPPEVLPRLGEAYVTAKRRRRSGRGLGRGRGKVKGRENEKGARQHYDGLGLGVFIAKTLLAHGGAEVGFQNSPQGGARVSVWWPRDIQPDAAAPLFPVQKPGGS